MSSNARIDWRSAATDAARAAVSDRLRDVTAAWAAARDRYLTLWSGSPPNVGALRKASQRYQELDRLRRRLGQEARQFRTVTDV